MTIIHFAPFYVWLALGASIICGGVALYVFIMFLFADKVFTGMLAGAGILMAFVGSGRLLEWWLG